MILIKIVLYFIYAFILIKLSTFIFEYLNSHLKHLIKYKRINYGILSMQDFYEYGLSTFLDLCKIYLEDLGFYNIEEAYVEYKNIDYICTKNNKKAYVGCVLEDLYLIQNKDSEMFSVGRPDIQKFLGQMVHDKVTKGIIITNACVTKEGIEFVEKLNSEYKILLVDGYTLSNRLREIHETNNLLGGIIIE